MTAPKRSDRRWQLPERHIWKLVCGLPESRAKAKRLLMLQVYIDDSGKPDQSEVQVLAGYLASAERWAAFSNEWQSILDENGIAEFHMSEAWRLSRRYQSPLVRNALLVRLIECIQCYAEHAFVSSLPYDAYHHWFATKEAPQFRFLRPYFFGFHSVLTQVYQYAFHNRFNQRVEVIFDEQGGESQRLILNAMDEFRSIADREFPGLVIPTPSFQSDRDALPLQAADMLAWLVRRDALNLQRGREREQLPEALLLGKALSMPSSIVIWDETKIEAAANDAVARFLNARRR